MCGIAGLFSYAREAAPISEEELIRTRDAMEKRGPDSAGLWISKDRRVGLAHRRLSIIDLSPSGFQPMASDDGLLQIVFNGEIYNFRELRADLESRGRHFRSTSDTEVLLHLYELKGERMVDDLRGMFTLAIWDERRQGLFLARDPYGIKPLFIADDGRTIRFASQVKALLESGHIDTRPEPAAHVGFFLWGHIPAPYTFYKGIRELPAGNTLWIDAGGPKRDHPYLSISEVIGTPTHHPPKFRPEEAREILQAALLDSVAHHMIADVEVSLFLSAGFDSATLLALAAEAVPNPIQTITLGFEEYKGTEKDESPLADLLAKHYGSIHHLREIRSEEFKGELPAILKAMDQPTVDGINTYCVSKVAAERGIKVALSGLGGDEIFGGYDSFRQIPSVVRKLRGVRHIPGLGKGFRQVSSPLLRRMTSPKYAGLLEYGSTYGGAYLLRRGLFMPWELPSVLDPEIVREGWRELQPLAHLEETTRGIQNGYCKVAALETAHYMRSQLLRDCDWAGMAHSLEIRVPLVDIELLRRIAPLMAQLQPPSKLDAANTLSRPLPRELFNRPKSGFNVPVRNWLMEMEGMKPTERGLRPWVKWIYAAFTEGAASTHRAGIAS